MIKRFRLISLKLNESDDFDSGFYQFSKEVVSASPKTQYTTLVIGPNGTGKSRILKYILDIFNDLYNYQLTGIANYAFKHYYHLVYNFGSDLYEIENKRELILKRNEKELSNISQVELPFKIIAAAYSLYEKFPPKPPIKYAADDKRRRTRYDNEFYEYLGIKSERNYTFSGSYIKKAIDLITEALANEGYSKDVKHVFDVLKFHPIIRLSYTSRTSRGSRELFDGKLTIDKFLEISNRDNFQKVGFRYSSYLRLSNSSRSYLAEVVEAMNEFSRLQNPRAEVSLELMFSETESQLKFNKKYRYISLLRSLNLIDINEVQVTKKVPRNPEGKTIELKSMSSGEIQILTSMLALSSIVKDSSIVLIDEPEISLHPNWQILYVEILNRVFRNYTSCHFIIATHSHFLVSDLKDSSSSILSLKLDNKIGVVPEFIDYSTEGWSAESILYNVFEVSTARNHYFETDLRTLLSLISDKTKKNRNKFKIRKLVEKFQRFNILPNDPLSLILKDARKLLDENK